MNTEYWTKWIKAAGIRAIKTVAQTAVATIGTSAVMGEVNWIEAWLARGEKEKAEKYVRGVLRYNVTPEFIVSERYCSADPWFTPWQPNASGSGRLCHLLLDYYGEKQA